MSTSGGEGYELFYINPQSVEAIRRHIARFVTTTDTVGMQAESKHGITLGDCDSPYTCFDYENKEKTLKGSR